MVLVATLNRSIGPSPRTEYARWPPPLFAYPVSSTTSHCAVTTGVLTIDRGEPTVGLDVVSEDRVA